ncbi:MAG: zinc metallopeptidase [Clostridia bacterium]|nr:zinc metallopeptidase [Clostridia bacterium]
MFFYYFQSEAEFILYLLMLIVAIGMMLVGFMFRRTFNRYSTQLSMTRMTGAQVAERILRGEGISGVRVMPCRGQLTDHYNPSDRTVYLSQSVYNSTSVAALGVAAHEMGHAIQHERGYVPLRLRSAMVPVLNITQRFAFIALLFGFLLDIFLFGGFSFFAWIGVAFYGLYTLFTFVTLPVELNASKRAMAALGDMGILSREEKAPARKVLTAAACTYLISFAYSLLQLLRLVAILSRSSNRRR